jgi:hypothetical protein
MIALRIPEGIALRIPEEVALRIEDGRRSAPGRAVRGGRDRRVLMVSRKSVGRAWAMPTSSETLGLAPVASNRQAA